jgi:hypothetical protein
MNTFGQKMMVNSNLQFFKENPPCAKLFSLPHKIAPNQKFCNKNDLLCAGRDFK